MRERGRIFHADGPKTENAREPTVESLVGGIWRLRAGYRTAGNNNTNGFFLLLKSSHFMDTTHCRLEDGPGGAEVLVSRLNGVDEEEPTVCADSSFCPLSCSCSRMHRPRQHQLQLRQRQLQQHDLRGAGPGEDEGEPELPAEGRDGRQYVRPGAGAQRCAPRHAELPEQRPYGWGAPFRPCVCVCVCTYV